MSGFDSKLKGDLLSNEAADSVKNNENGDELKNG